MGKKNTRLTEIAQGLLAQWAGARPSCKAEIVASWGPSAFAAAQAILDATPGEEDEE